MPLCDITKGIAASLQPLVVSFCRQQFYMRLKTGTTALYCVQLFVHFACCGK